MTEALTILLGRLPSLEIDLAGAVSYAKAEKSESTRRAYASDFLIFQVWCCARGVSSLLAAPESVAAFLASQAGLGLATSTLGRRVAAIRYAHRLAGHETPTDSEAVKATLRGIRRTLGAAPTRKSPVTAERVRAMVLMVPDSLKGLRDRSLLLLGFAGAFRRSELVALNVEDLEECEGGMRIRIRHSKTDQDGVGITLGISNGSVACPVKALKAWLSASGITQGCIFRPVGKGGRLLDARLSDKSVSNIVKHYAGLVGLDSSLFGGHSLRAGFLTSAAAKGASVFKMMDVSRHKSVDTLRGYVRDAELFRDHAGAGLL